MFANAKLYLDIAVGVLILGLLAFAGWEYDQRKLDADQLHTVGVQLSQQAAVLTQLQQGVQASNDAIKSMSELQTRAAVHGSAVRQRVVTMGNSNAAIHDWLSTSLPPGGCLLDDTCANGGSAEPAIGSASAVVPSTIGHAIRNGS